MRIKNINLKTGKLQELFHFYHDVMKMNIPAKSETSFSIKCGNSNLTFEEDKSFPEAFYHFAFNVPENQLNESIKWLEAKAELIALNGETIFDFKAWDAHSIYFYDPAGNIVEFIARHRLNNASTKPFSANSILSVSEIGMPVNKVRVFYEKLYSEIDLPLFTGDLKTFTAAGNDEGLIIIVPEERNWFPDCEPAAIYPISLEIEGINNSEILFSEYEYSIISSTNGLYRIE